MLHIDQSSVKSIQRMQIRIKEMKSETKRGFSSHSPPLLYPLYLIYDIQKKFICLFIHKTVIYQNLYSLFFTIYTINKEVTTFENIFKFLKVMIQMKQIVKA